MKLIKLDAIGSTNDFLKGLAGSPEVDNFTVVTAENQTCGKGQRGAKWESEAGKNLICSILVRDLFRNNSGVFDLNVTVAVGIIRALKNLEIPNLAIKWPNDIMSGKYKVGGILIENILKADGRIASIIGIGLNVNQIDFKHLPKASSLAILTDRRFSKEEVLLKIIDNLQELLSDWDQKSIENLWTEYNSGLFKRGVPMPFRSIEGEIFMGIIRDVSLNGRLRVELEDDTVNEYDIKEIQLLY